MTKCRMGMELVSSVDSLTDHVRYYKVIRPKMLLEFGEPLNEGPFVEASAIAFLPFHQEQDRNGVQGEVAWV